MAGVTCGVAALDPPPPGAGRSRERGGAPENAAPPPSDCVQASIDWSGLLVLEHMFTDFGKPMPATSIEGQFLGCEPASCSADILHAANPMNYISAKTPPMLIQQGDVDTQVPNKQPLGLLVHRLARQECAGRYRGLSQLRPHVHQPEPGPGRLGRRSGERSDGPGQGGAIPGCHVPAKEIAS